MISHVKETIPGVAGNCASGAAWTLAWITANVEPALHMLAVLVGILTSGATFAYYIVQWQAARAKRGRVQKGRRARGKRSARGRRV